MNEISTIATGAGNGQAFEVKRLGRYLGAVITGLDLSLPPDPATFARLESTLIEHKVIFVRDQHIDTEQQIKIGCMFGPLEVHPFATNDIDNEEILSIDTSGYDPVGVADNWHSDTTFRVCPTKYSILRCEIMPALGGNTLFADMCAAYDGLSDKMKHFIDGLDAVHDYPHFRERMLKTPEGRQRLERWESELPNPVHPVVRLHPVTGKKAIYVNSSFTQHIVGMKPRESRAVLDLLYAQTNYPEYQFRVRWKPGTITFWDNRSTQHYATNDYQPAHRLMRRVAVAGDRPFRERPND